MKASKTHLFILTLVVLPLTLLFGGCGGSSDPTPGITSHPPSTGFPAATPATPRPTSRTSDPGCTDQATFVAHATIPDDTVLAPGESFVKTWLLRNSGTCTWTSGYALFFTDGDRMGGANSIPLSDPVAPGEQVELSVTLTAPTNSGTYEGLWLLRNADGVVFGVGTYPNDTIAVRIVVKSVSTPPPTTPPPVVANWRGEYYDNPNLTGAPALIRDDEEINFDWSIGAPATDLPADNFSVRWTAVLEFKPGPYRFHAVVDDGIRLYVDNALVIDEWRDAGQREVTNDLALSAGEHSLRVEYYERAGGALIQFSWYPLSVYEDWRGEYYDNRDLIGAPILVREDPQIDFNWGADAPVVGLPADNFSIRWTRGAEFEEGTYRFHVFVDDGARVYVDNQLVIDTWRDGPPREEVKERDLTAGEHNLRVEYYEGTANATVQFWWEQVDPDFPDWKGEYWSNPILSGDPSLTQNEGAINFDWGAGSAAAGLPVDSWSARWTRRAYFHAATYRFHIIVDDGARVYVDDKLIIDEWRDGSAREATTDHALSSGEHNVRVEYYDKYGDAQVRLWWEKASSLVYSAWRGEYWANGQLDGNPTVVRNDLEIDFNWGTSSPAAGVPADWFSARWELTHTFDPDSYTFYAQADNGIRFYLDGQLLIDEWYSNGKDIFSIERTLQGAHSLVVEYHEGGGAASAKFWWTMAGAPSQPSPQPTVVPKPTPLPSPPGDEPASLWTAKYWANMALQGNPTVVRDETRIDFDWGDGSPAPGIPADKFSVRWEQQVTFEPDVYLFFAQADNGIRFYIDGQMLIEEWYSNGKDVFIVEQTLSGSHSLVVEYYENGGGALARFWWSHARGLTLTPGQARRK